MAPIKPGMYEFNKEHLVEIRKRMGVSQSRMAELLGIPPNTLSRWETGSTAPDACALAAIYSLAKEHGVDHPSFFALRASPLEVRMGSKPSGQSADSLSFFESLGSYLRTEIELVGTELAPVLKVEIRNTAPATLDWPKVVFTGVGLSLAHTGGVQQVHSPSLMKIVVSKKKEEDLDDTPSTPWENDSKRKDLLTVSFSRIDQKTFPEITPDEQQQGEMLLPSQSLVYELNVASELLPYLQLRTEGTISRRHLFHHRETFVMPENITKPPALVALSALISLDIGRTLESVITSMPDFNQETLLAEVQTFLAVLSSNLAENKALQAELNNLFRQHIFSWFRAHLRASYIYLDRVNATLARMKEAIESKTTDKIAQEASAILALKGEAALLGDERQELMSRFNISEEEIRSQCETARRQREEQALMEAARKKQKEEEARLAMEAAKEAETKQAQAVRQLRDELDLHGMSVREIIPLINKYLEDCHDARMQRVWIVHGKGDGILREAVGELLKIHRLVRAYRLADSGRGGEGATEVDLAD